MFEDTKDTWDRLIASGEKLCLLVSSDGAKVREELAQTSIARSRYFIVSKLYVEEAEQIAQILSTNTEVEYIIIENISTDQAWNKLLKVLDEKNYTPRVLVIGGEVPRAVWTRAARYYFYYPSPEAEARTGLGDETFKVVSWLDGVETHNKELLYGSTDNWNDVHTRILIDELDKQLLGESNFGFKLTRLRKNDISDCVTVLSSNDESQSIVLLLGLSLI